MMRKAIRAGWKPTLAVGGWLAAREAVGRAREESIAGEAALVTGGSRGLGFAIAERLLHEGCRVAICARDPEELARAQDRLAAHGEVLTIRCDIGERAAVEAMVAEVTQAFGRIDILVNNAGVITFGPLRATTMDDFEESMRVMYWGMVYATLAVLPQMRARHAGRIVNVTSFGGRVAAPHFAAYSAAKAAATSFSDSVRAEVLTDGICVTTVMPGEMRTGSHLHAKFAGHKETQYRLFAFVASLPTTTSAGRAARYIVESTKRRRAVLIFPWTFSLLTRAYGLAPGVFANLAAQVDRLLPSDEDVAPGSVEGIELEPKVNNSVWEAVTTSGRHAAERYNEVPPVAPPPGYDASGAATV